MKVVISCQHCIRQYEVDSDMHGKLARCEACKAYFIIQIAVPEMGGEAIYLENALEPHYNFTGEAVACLACNIKIAFLMASESYTPENAMKFARSMPETCDDLRGENWGSKYCNTIMLRGHMRSRTLANRHAHWMITDYFFRQFPCHPPTTQRVLIGAFVGALSVEFDEVGGLAVIPKKRWFGRNR